MPVLGSTSLHALPPMWSRRSMHDDVETALGGPLGDGQSVQARADDDEVGAHQASSRSTAGLADGCRCQGVATGTLAVACSGTPTVKVRR